MNNNITEWSYDKPTEPGLYLVCGGDVETPANIEPLQIVENDAPIKIGHWDRYSISDVKSWHDSFKFARLCVGSECAE